MLKSHLIFIVINIIIINNNHSKHTFTIFYMTLIYITKILLKKHKTKYGSLSNYVFIVTFINNL